MRLTPWILPFALSAALLTTTSYVFADNHESEGGHEPESGQYEPLDDAALEEEYGIKAGSVKREESEESDSEHSTDTTNGAGNAEEDSSEENSDDDRSSASNSDDENNGEVTDEGEETAEGGTGGTGSSEDAIENGEDEESTDYDE
jgi:hypothetical protein